MNEQCGRVERERLLALREPRKSASDVAASRGGFGLRYWPRISSVRLTSAAAALTLSAAFIFRP
jgi:hypothetical protein